MASSPSRLELNSVQFSSRFFFFSFLLHVQRFLAHNNFYNLVRKCYMPFPTSVICEISFYIGGYCEELDAFSSLNFIQHSHTTLEDLELKGWAKLNSLPGEIQHFIALETLFIDSFDGIETLPEWLGNLSSLKTLRIWDCNRDFPF